MAQMWCLFVQRGGEYERDFCGLFDDVTINTLKNIAPLHRWQFRSDRITGWNPKWDKGGGPEFAFERWDINIYHVPAQLV